MEESPTAESGSTFSVFLPYGKCHLPLSQTDDHVDGSGAMGRSSYARGILEEVRPPSPSLTCLLLGRYAWSSVGLTSFFYSSLMVLLAQACRWNNTRTSSSTGSASMSDSGASATEVRLRLGQQAPHWGFFFSLVLPAKRFVC